MVAFDGDGFRQILPADPLTRKVTALLPLAAGRILLGTAGHGVFSFDGKTLATVDPARQLLDRHGRSRPVSLAGGHPDAFRRSRRPARCECYVDRHLGNLSSGGQHLAARDDYRKIATLLDRTQPAGKPAFFSANLWSLSEVFSEVREVEIRTRDTGADLRESVRYRMR